MPEKIAIIYNNPTPGKYHAIGEGIAVEDVLDSVESVAGTLDKLGYKKTCIPLCQPLETIKGELTKIDANIVFNLFEGFDGYAWSEAAVAKILEELDLCFTGASSNELILCEDKSKIKETIEANGIPTPVWQVLSPKFCSDFDLQFPCIVKPLHEHASHGLSEKSVVYNFNALRERVGYIWNVYKHPSLVEKFLPGREFRVLIVGNEHPIVYPIEEIIYTLPTDKPRLLTYSAKWIIDHEYYEGSYEECPAEVGAELQSDICTIALKSYTSLNCHGYASIDIRQDEMGQLMVIDVNPNTDIYEEGGVQLPLETAGIEYATFIEKILSLARQKHESCRLLKLNKSVVNNHSSSS